MDPRRAPGRTDDLRGDPRSRTLRCWEARLAGRRLVLAAAVLRHEDADMRSIVVRVLRAVRRSCSRAR